MSLAVPDPLSRASDDSAEGPVVFADPHSPAAPIRLLLACEGWTATPQITFVEGLRRWREAGAATLCAVTEPTLEKLRATSGGEAAKAFLAAQFDRISPTALVLSRFAGPDARTLVSMARERRIPVVFQLDDDLFEAPISLGAAAYARYRHPVRLHTVYWLAETADVVLASTPELARRIRQHCEPAPIFVGEPFVGARAAAAPSGDKAAGEVRLGYMGSGTHGSDLELVAPALERILATHPQVSLHFFGGIGKTRVARAFADRASFTPRVDGAYTEFRGKLSGLGWDIGLAPLRTSPFNACKTITKWVEYAEPGIAVLASASSPYDAVGQAGAARLCSPDEWEQALAAAILDADARAGLVENSRRLLAERYSWELVERWLVDLLLTLPERARSRAL